MIENRPQYHITKSVRSTLQRALADFDIREATVRIGSKILAEAELAALEGEIDVLSGQISDYEARVAELEAK